MTNPTLYLWRMLAFIVAVAVLAGLLSAEVGHAFAANPLLNTVIFGVLLLGIVWNIRQVLALTREVEWIEAFRKPAPGAPSRPAPKLLGPMASMLASRKSERLSLSAMAMRSVLDGIGARLDESREISRYATGLLIFLGLLGTFWGLLLTIGSVAQVINDMSVGTGDINALFNQLKSGLAEPLRGMSIAFSSSMLGLAGALVLGFLDLQAGQAQNRFYTELEDWLSTMVRDLGVGSDGVVATGAPSNELRVAIERLKDAIQESSSSRAATTAMANLAEAIQGLVHHMRTEQQMIRDWVDSQAEQHREIRRLLEILVRESTK
jgi:hypothetical protein